MSSKRIGLLCFAIGVGHFLFGNFVQAQNLPIGGHYVGGTAGLDVAGAPPPGFYVRDFNYFYGAHKIDGVPVDADVFYFAQAPRLIYVASGELLGASYGAHLTIPFIYKSVSTPVASESQFDLGDVQVNPIQLMWNWNPLEFAFGYGMFIPSGNFDGRTALKRLTSPSKGFWSHMLIASGGWRIDKARNWMISLTGHYELCQEQEQTRITPGDAFTLEWGLGRSLGRGVQAGVTGYYLQQLHADTGAAASKARLSALGIGPEVTAFWPSHGWGVTLRYAYELEARNRPQGHLGLLILT
jgi:hypothetical protein